jgi:hypothetical protein
MRRSDSPSPLVGSGSAPFSVWLTAVADERAGIWVLIIQAIFELVYGEKTRGNRSRLQSLA